MSDSQQSEPNDVVVKRSSDVALNSLVYPLQKQRSRSSSSLAHSTSNKHVKMDSDSTVAKVVSRGGFHLIDSRRKRSSSSLVTNNTENTSSPIRFKQPIVLSSSYNSVLNTSKTSDFSISTIYKPIAKHLKFTVTSPDCEKESNDYIVNVFLPNGEQKTLIRRFRQFVTLHQSIQKSYPEVELPKFPKKTIFNHNNERRKKKLENYLNFIVTIPGIEDLLGLVTFLGSDIFSNYKSTEEINVTFNTKENNESESAKDRRYKEVEQFIIALDKCIDKINAIEEAFEEVYDTSDFIKISEFSKLVVILGKLLGKIPIKGQFVPKELRQDQIKLITNDKILSIRKKITPAISEILHKLSGIRESLLDVELSMEKVLELEHLIDDIQEVFYGSYLITRSLGHNIEAGLTKKEIESIQYPRYIEDNVYWYKEEFFGQDHLVCYGNTPNGDYIISIKPLHLGDNYGEFKIYMCNKDGNETLTVKTELENPAAWKSSYQSIITSADLRLRGVSWNTCDGKEVELHIKEHESKDMRITRKLKFGILLCLKDQVKEEDMFSNQEEIPPFKEFLDFMGQRIELAGYNGYAGGLDNRGTNTTGTHSLITSYKGPKNTEDFSIMFHVSTMLPHGEQDQQLAKKRHIGNDIVLVVFQEEGSNPFHPTTVKSNYIQIIIVVRHIHCSEGKNFWHVNVCSAQDVPPFGPPLPYPPIFDDKHKLREWLIEKMISGELASYNSKLFIQQLRSTYKTLLSNLMEEMPNPKKKGSKNNKKK